MSGRDAILPRLLDPDDRLALVHGDRKLTYRELDALVRSHAEKLRELGAKPGDRIGVWAAPRLETLVAMVTNLVSGMVTVPLNPASGERELAHVLGDARPSLCFSGTEPTSVVLPELLADERPFTLAPDAALILYTSGTTGLPKGAVLTRSGIAANLDALAQAWSWTEADRLVHALPVFHVHGLVLGVFGALRVGSSLEWLPKFSPEAVARAFDGGATMLFAVPTMYHRIADAAEADAGLARAIAKARLLVSGSAALSTREHTRLEKLLGQSVRERYGLTETLINCAVRENGAHRPGYVGPPVAGVELRLVDDERRPLAEGDDSAAGEIAVRGPNVFFGYLNRPDATAAVLDDEGWFYTGDLATVSADGYVRIIGRKSTDLIKTGGFKVGAGEIESALLEHPAVSEAAVIGVSDDDLGERIVAFVVLRGNSGGAVPASVSESELTQFVATLLAKHKRPRAVRFVDKLPRNAMGKVVKAELRKFLSDQSV